MVNEEDHLRVQFMLSGFRLPEVWDAVNQLDDRLEEHLAYAFSPQLGYLTACPTNVGTGIRVGVMLHLPGPGPDQADRQGLPRPPEDQPGRPRPVRRGEPGLRRLLPDLQPADARQGRARADQDPHRRRAPGPPVRARGPPDPPHRAPAAPARPGQPGLRRPEDRPDNLQRRNYASPVERADGDQPGPDRRPVDRHGQRAVHPDPAGVPPEAPRLGAGRRGAERRPGHRTCGAGYPTGGRRPGIERLAGRGSWKGGLRPPDRPSRSDRPAPTEKGRSMSQFSFEIDPLKVLGVTADASLEQIRDAYRQKAKRYHPDAGGEDWIFRILSQSYELLCSARVVRATHFAAAPVAGGAAATARAELRDRPSGHPRQGRRSLARRGRRAPLRPLPLGRRQLSLARPGRARAGAFPELQSEHQLARLARLHAGAAIPDHAADPRDAGGDLRRDDHRHAGDQLAVARRERPVRRLAELLQLRPVVQGPPGAAPGAAPQGPGDAAVVARPVPPRAWQFDRTEPPGGPRR